MNFDHPRRRRPRADSVYRYNRGSPPAFLRFEPDQDVLPLRSTKIPADFQGAPLPITFHDEVNEIVFIMNFGTNKGYSVSGTLLDRSVAV